MLFVRLHNTLRQGPIVHPDFVASTVRFANDETTKEYVALCKRMMQKEKLDTYTEEMLKTGESMEHMLRPPELLTSYTDEQAHHAHKSSLKGIRLLIRLKNLNLQSEMHEHVAREIALDLHKLELAYSAWIQDFNKNSEQITRLYSTSDKRWRQPNKLDVLI